MIVEITIEERQDAPDLAVWDMIEALVEQHK
jgi:hypothetical protein